MNVVTGMHRSGTSFCALLFSRLGCDFGPADGLFAADKWNQSGYFEAVDVVDVNNKLILGPKVDIERWINAPEGAARRMVNSIKSQKWRYLLFPGEQKIASNGVLQKEQLERVYQQHRQAYVKDPRFCLTLHVWYDYANIESLTFSFRSPMSVAGSLKRREKLPLFYGVRYWHYHIENFFRAVDVDTPLYLVNFDDFFAEEKYISEFRSVVSRFTRGDDSAVKSLVEELDFRQRTQWAMLDSGVSKVDKAYESLKALHSNVTQGEPIFMRDFPKLHEDLAGRPPE